MSLLTARREEMSFCPGCSHGRVLELIAAAVARLGVPPQRVCVVSDIGCIGMSDRYFECHTFHGLHGRSVTYAEGLKRVRPELLVIVLIGDGGCGIGTGHLVHAARRGADVKVIVCNNFNFGMTGGQHSPTTPPGGRTPTTPGGACEVAFDVCGTVAANGASYAARCSAYDPDCGERIEEALRAPGFAVVDVWELCAAYYVGANRLTPARLAELSDSTGLRFGVTRGAAVPGPAADAPPLDEPRGPTPERAGRAVQLDWRVVPVGLRVAGSAGQRIRSAVGVLGETLVAGGLYAAQYDDFPISVRKGHSVSDLLVSDRPIRYAAVYEPDLVLVLSADGQKRAGDVSAVRRVWVEEALAGGFPAGAVRFRFGELERVAGKGGGALAALTAAVVRAGWVGATGLREAARSALTGKYAEANRAAISAGIAHAERASSVEEEARKEGGSRS